MNEASTNFEVPAPRIAAGIVTLYRFYNVGYSINLVAAEQSLAAQTKGRIHGCTEPQRKA